MACFLALLINAFDYNAKGYSLPSIKSALLAKILCVTTLFSELYVDLVKDPKTSLTTHDFAFLGCTLYFEKIK